MAENNKGIPRDFFYRNAFWREGEGKAKAMQFGVRNNLAPFHELLSNLLQNNDKLMRVSASIYPVDSVVTLEPEFCIVKPTLGKETKYALPSESYYIMEWEDEYGDIADFIEITDRRRDFVLAPSDKVDYFDGCVIFKCDHEPQGALTLWFNYRGEEKSISCEITKINYEMDFGKYRISALKEVKGVRVENSVLTIQDISDDKIILFDCVSIKSVGQTESLDASKFTAENGKKVRYLDSGYCIVYSDEVKKLFYNGAAVHFTRVGEKEYPQILNDKRIVAKGSALSLADRDMVSDGIFTSTYSATFSCKTGSLKATPRYNEGMFVMIEDDGSYDSDFLTSTSFFFREDIEELTDVERSRTTPHGGRTFRIGKKFEEESIIEIVEIIGGRRHKIKDLPSKLYIVSNPFQLRMQMNAVNILMNEPAPHHKALLQLMDSRFTWGDVDTTGCRVKTWHRLTDDNYDGVEEQRKFVKLALSTKDFAFLEGPPGSGKTTTILEIIAQMIERGERVILAASTNAAIDNILERLEKIPQVIRNKILAVRIGNDGSVCETVDHYRPDIIEDPALQKVVLERANLVCGTTFGVLRHPEFNLNSRKKGTSAIIPPLFDCLIVDEASKTTFQDFLVPAIFAKKWILSGDINQLTPYIEKEDIASSIRYMNGFDEKLQDIQGIIQQLSVDNNLGRLRFCIPVGQQYLRAIAKLAPPNQPYLCIGNIDEGICVSANTLLNGGEGTCKLYGARIIFVSEDHFVNIQPLLPSDVIVLRKDEADARHSYYANSHYFASRSHRFKGIKLRGGSRRDTEYNNIDDIRKELTRLLQSKDWAGELAWRVARQQELFMLARIDKENGDKVRIIEKQIQERIPQEYKAKINTFLSLIRELSLPSILQLLKQGISENLMEKTHKTTLNSGFEDRDYRSRSALLQYQGRMHGDISAFCRELLYNNEALQDSRILDRRWDYIQSRSIWIDVAPDKKCENENIREIDAIVAEIEKFAVYAVANPKRQDPEDGGCYSIAILTYYKKQEALIKRAIAKLTNSQSKVRSVYPWECKNIRIEVYSVDKYQGKEADIVFLSMIKCGQANLGFMDSPNRLNVALTRAKFLRVIVGSRQYFKTRSRNYLLQKLEGSI